MINLQAFPKIQTKYHSDISGINEKTALLSKSFLTKENTNSLFIANRTKIYAHLSTNAIKKKANGFLLEILFHGLNYNAKRLKPRRPKYHIDVHKSEVFVCNEQATNVFKSRIYKRRLVFFSFDQHLLKQIEKRIKSCKMPNAYTGKGLYSRTDKYILKEGKKRK